MPQVDHVSFFNQAFWSTYYFFSLFFFFAYWGFEIIRNTISLRFLNTGKRRNFLESIFFSDFFSIKKKDSNSLVLYFFTRRRVTFDFSVLKLWAFSFFKKANTFLIQSTNFFLLGNSQRFYL